ncbi:MAG TPA: MlaD family protein [Bryobacteraceae bacterium]|nr:MlaD family protein [Bryobacteraceae bacterium]
MADRGKLRWAQLKVGVVALTACIVLVVLIFLLTSTRGFWQHYVILHTYMDDASGMIENTPVRLNGITVGYLDSLRLTQSADPRRTVRFDMKVREKYLEDIPVDSMVGISASNLLGDKFLNITRGKSTQFVHAGGELRALETQDIPELMAQSANLLQSFQIIVNRVDSLLAGVEQGKGNIGKLLKDEELYDRLDSIAAEGQQMLSDIRTGNGTISKLIYDPGLYQDMRAPLQRLDSILAGLQNGQGTAGKLLKDPALYDEAHQSLAEIRQVMQDINAGKGTAGKLLKDDQLYQRLDTLIAKFSATVDQINSGQGTIGQLMVNPQLYESLNGATREFQGLAHDIRANPKKFLRIRLALF